jgi:hypothetical protein
MVMPTGKCPNCIRCFAYHRIARRLNSCVGIGGRRRSQNTKAKLTESTPRDYRAGTPRPTPTGVRGLKEGKVDRENEDDEEEKTPVIKKIKKKKKKGAVVGKEKVVKEVE